MRSAPARHVILPGLLALALAGPASAQFASPQVVPTGDGVRHLRLVDLDGDGDLDLVTSSHAGAIRWNENLGAGVFSGPRFVDDVLEPGGLNAADLDGDGDQDLLVSVTDFSFVPTDNDRVQWYPNMGGGVFGPALLVSDKYGWPQGIDTADWDGDGDLDCAVAAGPANTFMREVRMFEGVGLGGLAVRPPIYPSSHPSEVEFCDLGGSALPDLLVATHLNIAWFENLGGGSFGPERILVADLNSAEDARAVDLDGDGDLDVLFAVTGHDKVAWVENLGNGDFGDEQVITLQADFVLGVDAGDLDGDGDLDVLASSHLGDQIARFENLGGGVFGPWQKISAQFDGPSRVRPGDLDGDGDLEVVAVSDEVPLVWFENLQATGTSYCSSSPNSTGFAAQIQASGSASASAGLLSLDIAPVPDEIGLVFHAAGTAQAPFGNGTLCIAGGIIRGAPVVGVGNAASYTYDLSDPKHDLSAYSGSARHFQYWFRDTAAGGAGFDLSDALVIPILP
jgi:hypothetical protein